MIYAPDDNLKIIEATKSTLPRESKTKVTAESYQVTDISDNSIILQKDQSRLFPLASVSKLVTAVVARKLIDSEKYVTLTPKILSTYGNEAKFRVGEKIKVGELMYPLLMVSSNDSAEALASAYPLGRQKFLKEMNNWVNSIGAYRTYFRDPSGLSPENVSTAEDVSIITKWILANDPEIFDITLTKTKTIRTHTWTNATHFLNLSTFAGGKNGYTPEAGRTSVYLFRLGKQKKLFSVVILDSSARDVDTMNLIDQVAG